MTSQTKIEFNPPDIDQRFGLYHLDFIYLKIYTLESFLEKARKAITEANTMQALAQLAVISQVNSRGSNDLLKITDKRAGSWENIEGLSDEENQKLSPQYRKSIIKNIQQFIPGFQPSDLAKIEATEIGLENQRNAIISIVVAICKRAESLNFSELDNIPDDDLYCHLKAVLWRLTMSGHNSGEGEAFLAIKELTKSTTLHQLKLGDLPKRFKMRTNDFKIADEHYHGDSRSLKKDVPTISLDGMSELEKRDLEYSMDNQGIDEEAKIANLLDRISAKLTSSQLAAIKKKAADQTLSPAERKNLQRAREKLKNLDFKA